MAARRSATPGVSVIVPARDAAATIGRTLDALAAQRLTESHEVVVVDAGSRDATAGIVAEAPGPVRIVCTGPVGPGEARNRGVAAARGVLLAFTDADCFPAPGWLAAGVAELERGAALVQGAVSPDPEARMGPFDRWVGVGREAGLYETANLFLRRDAFDGAGGFEEWLRPTIGASHMAEDVLLGWRVRRAGGRTAFRADAVVHHAVFPRTAAGFVGEHRRRRYFPEMASRVPELRNELFFGRIFLARRTAAFDLAVLGLLLARGRRSPVPLGVALPYIVAVTRASRRWRGRAPMAKIIAANVAADTVGCYSLVLGSLRTGTLVL